MWNITFLLGKPGRSQTNSRRTGSCLAWSGKLVPKVFERLQRLRCLRTPGYLRARQRLQPQGPLDDPPDQPALLFSSQFLFFWVLRRNKFGHIFLYPGPGLTPTRTPAYSFLRTRVMFCPQFAPVYCLLLGVVKCSQVQLRYYTTLYSTPEHVNRITLNQ